TPFNDTRFDLIKGQLQEDIDIQTAELEKLKGEEKKYTDTLEKVNTGISTINNFIINVQTTYRTIEAELNRLKLDKPQEFTSIQNIISENTITLTAKSEEKVKFDDEYKYLAIL